MGGRGASSATATKSANLSSGSFVGTGSKQTDKLVNDALKEYRGIEINNKLKENVAKNFLGNGNENPSQKLKERIKKMREYNDRDIKDSKNFKRDYAEREKYAKQQSDLATKYANGDKKVKAVDVRGHSYEKMSVRADRQTAKAVQLNKGLTVAKSEQKNREKRINDFKNTFPDKVRSEVRKALLAEDYLKKKRKK